MTWLLALMLLWFQVYLGHFIWSITSEMFMAKLRLTIQFVTGSFEAIILQLTVKTRNYHWKRITAFPFGITARGDKNAYTIDRPTDGFESTAVDHQRQFGNKIAITRVILYNMGFIVSPETLFGLCSSFSNLAAIFNT